MNWDNLIGWVIVFLALVLVIWVAVNVGVLANFTREHGVKGLIERVWEGRESQ